MTRELANKLFNLCLRCGGGYKTVTSGQRKFTSDSSLMGRRGPAA